MSRHALKLSLAWVLLLLLAALVRLGVALYWEDYVHSHVPEPIALDQDGPFFFGDSDSYWKLGRALAFGRRYEFDSERHWQIFRTPGYPAILAPLFWIFGEYPSTLYARLEGVAFGVLNVALIGLLALRMLPRGRASHYVAYLASACAAFDPAMALQCVCILSEEPFLTFLLLQMLLFTRLLNRLALLPYPSVATDTKERRQYGKISRDAALLGVVTAVTIYLRPSWYYFLTFATPMILLAPVLWRYVTKKSATKLFANIRLTPLILALGLFCLCYTICLAPWAVRNYRLAGKFIPTSLQLGASLYDGLNPTANGASDMSFVDVFREEERQFPSDDPNVHFEVRLDNRLKDAAVLWSLEHPLDVCKLACVKIIRLWSPTPHDSAFSRPVLKAILFLSYTPIMLMGLFGAFLALKRNPTLLTLLLPALYVTLLHSIFVASIRYRVPVFFGFYILASYALIVLTNTAWKRRCSPHA
ncbi:MAG: hypothetical protein Q4G03_03505 [Planctomycetia bacterium]|nr:hypothetical protein [Planctomycetia bacterium]